MAVGTSNWRIQHAVLLYMVSLATGAHLVVNTSTSIFKVDAEFISANLDFEMIATDPDVPRWYTFNPRHPRVVTLLGGLSPCYLRFGGSAADTTVMADPPSSRLYNLSTSIKINTIYPTDIDKLVELSLAAGCRLLYDLNLEVRLQSGGWDPTNALSILNHMDRKGYGDNVDFELGNEPDYPMVKKGSKSKMDSKSSTKTILAPSTLSGKQIGEDYLVLKELLQGSPTFRNSKMVGADIVGIEGLKTMMPDFLKTAGKALTATTFHHYYFEGLGAHPSEYINPAHFDTVRSTMRLVKDLVKENSPTGDLPVWIGETADSWHSGTENVTDRYISGFLWLDKLGLAAQMGIGVVMRQTFYAGFYGLIDNALYPNPDYWLSYIHKQFVGRVVLNTTVQEDGTGGKSAQWRHLTKSNSIKYLGAGPSLVRLYAHCAKISPLYPQGGGLTVFGINLKNETEVVTFEPELANQKVDQYLLTPVGKDGLLSKEVAVNGQVLRLMNDHTFPALKPRRTIATSGFTFPPLTFGFWVFPYANISICL